MHTVPESHRPRPVSRKATVFEKAVAEVDELVDGATITIDGVVIAQTNHVDLHANRDDVA